MLTYAVVVFAVGALGGVVLASFVLRGRFPPWALSLLHAGLGGTGLVLVGIAVFTTPLSTPLIVAIVLLVTTALTGLYLASRHYRNMLTPKALVVTHATLALTFLIILSSTVFGFIW
jgi:hypothetical protein